MVPRLGPDPQGNLTTLYDYDTVKPPTNLEGKMDYFDDFDWDQSDENQYCKHGKFIGSWWGPDILCGYCEVGD